MNTIIKQILAIILSFFIIGVSSLSYHLYQRKKLHQEAIPTYEQMTNATVKQYQEDGTLKNTITAQKWTNHQDKGYSDLEDPLLVIFKEDGQKWHITSETAKIMNDTPKGKEIILNNDVHVNRSKTQNSSGLDLYTQELHYFPKTNDVISDKNVELNQPGLIIQGRGLVGNTDTKNVEILENTKTRYNPNSYNSSN